jgi:hypothetical protein
VGAIRPSGASVACSAPARSSSGWTWCCQRRPPSGRSGRQGHAVNRSISAARRRLDVGPIGSISGHGLASPQSTVTITFDYTGDAQSWTVPTGVTEATFVVNGAAGGLDVQNATGLGGQAEATLAVTAGAVYTIVVGGAGESIRQAGPTRSGGRGGYGYGPGGAGGAPWSTNTSVPGAGGGGGSAVLLGTDVLLVGGGGGGSSNNPAAGGAGGGARGSAGQANTTDPDHVWDGQGGTQTGPGAGGVGVTRKSRQPRRRSRRRRRSRKGVQHHRRRRRGRRGLVRWRGRRERGSVHRCRRRRLRIRRGRYLRNADRRRAQRQRASDHRLPSPVRTSDPRRTGRAHRPTERAPAPPPW